jgi:hypothetical protein
LAALALMVAGNLPSGNIGAQMDLNFADWWRGAIAQNPRFGHIA